MQKQSNRKGVATNAPLAAVVLAAGAALSAGATANASTLYAVDYTSDHLFIYGNAGDGNTTYTAGAISTIAVAQSTGIAVDPNGYVNIDGYGSNPVSGYTSTGTLVKSSGTVGVGNNYSSVYANGTIYVSTTGGAIYSVADNLPAAYGTPGTTSYNGGGNVNVGIATATYTYNSGANTDTYLFVIARDANTLYAFDLTRGTTAATVALNTISGLSSITATYKASQPAVDASGDIYFGNYYGAAGLSTANAVFKLTPTVNSSTGALTFTGSEPFTSGYGGYGMAVGPDGNLYQAGGQNDAIYEYNVSNSSVYTYATLTTAPYAVAFSPGAVPEPATLATLSLLGLGALARPRRRKA